MAITPVFTTDQLAAICHDANASLCCQQHDDTQPAWVDAPDWQKDSARKGVALHLGANVGSEASHNSWMAEKVATGWVYGPVKDPEAIPPTHPCMVPFDELPPEQQAKDHLFRGIVHALAPFVAR